MMRILALLAWLWQVGSTPAPLAVAGTYTVEGTTAQGVYHGTARVQQRGRVVFVEWRLASGEEHAGLGLLTGTSVSVGYGVGDIGAVAVYALTKDGDAWVGEWPDSEDGSLQQETLTRQRGERQAATP